MRLHRVVFAALAALLAGCESGTPVEPEVNVDSVLDQMAASGISSWSTASANSAGGPVAVPVPAGGTAASCPYNASTKFFVCAPVSSNGMTFSRQFQLLDATGTPLSAPNPLMVAAIRSVIDLEGTVTQGATTQTTIQVDRHEDATLSGIQSTKRVLNGASTQMLTVTGSSFGFTSNEVSSTTNLQLPSSPEQKYPLGGNIVTDATITSSGVATSTIQQKREISFDGTSLMTVKITTGTAVVTCTVNMAAPGTPPTCS
jgi:hypothetical protein